jgi:hypothetical protein
MRKFANLRRTYLQNLFAITVLQYNSKGNSSFTITNGKEVTGTIFVCLCNGSDVTYICNGTK